MEERICLVETCASVSQTADVEALSLTDLGLATGATIQTTDVGGLPPWVEDLHLWDEGPHSVGDHHKAGDLLEDSHLPDGLLADPLDDDLLEDPLPGGDHLEDPRLVDDHLEDPR